jgi:pimeloyl-ACP methyl ester carboxylesterase
VLRLNFADPDKVTPALAREWTDLNNRAQNMPPAPDSKPIAGYLTSTPGYLPRISAPTLLLWSANDPEVPVETVGRKGLELLGSTDKALEVVPHCGHMLPIECGVESAPLAAAFLDRIEAGSAAGGTPGTVGVPAT